MAAKSTLQRIVEIIAVLAVAGIAVVAVVIISLRPGAKNKGEPVAVAPAPNLPTKGSPNAGRPTAVATHPKISELKLNPRRSTSPVPEGLPAVDANQVGDVTMRHLNTHSVNQVMVAPDEETAILIETTPLNKQRIAVWNLASGKLVRFLSTELGSATRAYEGKEDADFGGKVESDWFGPRQAFSPSGKRFAIEQRSENVASKVLIWDVASGRLLSQSQEFFQSQLPLVFATEEYVVLDTTISGPDAALVRIHASSGEADLLRPIGAANGTSGFHQMVAGSTGLLTYAAYAGLNTIDVNSRVHTQSESVSKYRRPQYLATWLSSDESEFLACSRDCLIDRWDVTTGERTSSRTFIPSLPEIEQAWAAPAAGIVAFCTKENDVHLYDLSTRRRVSLIRVPFRQGKLEAMSSDGKRLIFSTDQRTLLVMQYTEQLPHGMLDLAELLSKRELAATR